MRDECSYLILVAIIQISRRGLNGKIAKIHKRFNNLRREFLMSSYESMKRDMITGWNTYNNWSVMSYVYMPHSFAITIGLKEHELGNTWSPKHLRSALIGRFQDHEEEIHPNSHAYNGSYTELKLSWRNIEILVQSGVFDDELVVLITPIKNQKRPATIIVEAGILWNRDGTINCKDGVITGSLPNKTINVYTTGKQIVDFNVETVTPYMAVVMDSSVGISTAKSRSLKEIQSIIEVKKLQHEKIKDKYGDLSEVHNAMQSCMAWDTIYEPSKDRVVTPVSRLWNRNWGGYVLFCWDTYFAAYLASVDNKELAYSNAIEITREKTENGFIPNYAADCDLKSRDRSQPPVGSMVVKEIYRRYREKWFLEEIYDDLVTWNNWWVENRKIGEGLLAWGSNPFDPLYGGRSEIDGVNDTLGGALESGLDNSPMYDDIPFDKENHHMKLADVGLIGLYIMDCNALSDIAHTLGKFNDEEELRRRSKEFSSGLQTLWDEKTGMFLNKRTDTGEFSNRISPTNFYALFSNDVTKKQSERMIQEHFYNPNEFWGEWIMPSISRNDPAYKEQFYWRGRIWAPMNFLVYIAMRNHRLVAPCKDLAVKSKNLLLKEWLEHGHIHENYSAVTGNGCGISSSDKFYHWGGLLGLIALMEDGYVQGVENIL